jgi:NADH-quinone oxidoreductase subunit G
MCDEGRFGFHYVNAAERFRRPLTRRDNQLVPTPWEQLLPVLRKELAETAAQNGSAMAGVLSPFLTCEEAYLLARYLKGLSGEVRLALGPVPVVGEDDHYPKDCRGRSVQPVKFTIRAEKCPNRRGVEEVLRHFQGEVIRFDDVVWAAGEGQLQALWIAAGYPPRPGGWIRQEQAVGLKRVPLLVVQDLLPSPASEAPKYVIPAASFAEKDGTFVNHAGLAQAIRRAVRPPGEVRTEGQVFLDLMQRRGLVHAATLRAEMARDISFFAPLAQGDLGEHGVMLGAK